MYEPWDNFSMLVHAQRQYAEMTQAEVAKHLGLSQSHISMIFNGVRSIPKVMLDDLGYEAVTIYIRKS